MGGTTDRVAVARRFLAVPFEREEFFLPPWTVCMTLSAFLRFVTSPCGNICKIP